MTVKLKFKMNVVKVWCILILKQIECHDTIYNIAEKYDIPEDLNENISESDKNSNTSKTPSTIEVNDIQKI